MGSLSKIPERKLKAKKRRKELNQLGHHREIKLKRNSPAKSLQTWRTICQAESTAKKTCTKMEEPNKCKRKKSQPEFQNPVETMSKSQNPITKTIHTRIPMTTSMKNMSPMTPVLSKMSNPHGTIPSPT